VYSAALAASRDVEDTLSATVVLFSWVVHVASAELVEVMIDVEFEHVACRDPRVAA
jgi:hypothetical protein